jgi:hypothetical protein
MAKRNGVCDRFCNGCIYNGYFDGRHTICEYYLVTNERRPCPAGTGCTVKKTGKKISRWEYEKESTWQKREKQQKQQKKIQIQTKEKGVYHRVCPCCGTEFDTTNKRQIYCCKNCKFRMAQRAWNKRKKAKKGGNKHGQETA